jgi:hypothetical protein
MYELKSKVNFPADVLQSPRCTAWPFYQELHTTHFCDKSVSGLVSAVFVYRPILKMAAPLSNFTVVKQRLVTGFL